MNFGEKIEFDAIDAEILKERAYERNLLPGPRTGDYVMFPCGTLERLNFTLIGTVQTAPRAAAAFYLRGGGGVECAGGLNPRIQVESLKLTEKTLRGEFWFFHHDQVGAHRRVNCETECRVYVTSDPYQGFLRDGF